MTPWTSRLVWAACSLAAQLAMGLNVQAAESEPVVHGSYLCGGIGEDGVQAMRDLRQPYNLRLKFAQARTGEYVAGVAVRVEPRGTRAQAGQTPVGPVDDCGPLMYLRLQPGNYRISATYGEVTLKRNVHVGRMATELVLYWPSK